MEIEKVEVSIGDEYLGEYPSWSTAMSAIDLSGLQGTGDIVVTLYHEGWDKYKYEFSSARNSVINYNDKE
jgi:hypothetical protein